MNPGVGITREDLELASEPVISRVAALEAPVVANVEADVVTGSEFRLFKWLGTFALATVMAGFGLLYQQVSDLRVGLERLHTDVLGEIHGLRSEMHAGFASIREEMHTEHESIREDISGVRERVVRVETLLDGSVEKGR